MIVEKSIGYKCVCGASGNLSDCCYDGCFYYCPNCGKKDPGYHEEDMSEKNYQRV